jgi:hypothetical protein
MEDSLTGFGDKPLVSETGDKRYKAFVKFFRPKGFRYRKQKSPRQNPGDSFTKLKP